jgi:hypothetical protein
VKILEVTTGDKLACIKAEGTPPQQRGAADCPAEFHP